MRLYKYRDLSLPGNEAFERLCAILRSNSFWCARPSTLNDPAEFIWECDYSPSDATIELLTRLLTSTTSNPLETAISKARAVVHGGRIEPIVRPVFEDMIEQCRQEYGLACFATSSENEVMWERYGGRGNGVCIEIEAPDHLLHTHLHPVQYPLAKRLHVDQLLSSYTERSSAKLVYEVALLSKPAHWAPEAEVRFVSKNQDVAVQISGSRISRLIIGPSLSNVSLARIEALALSMPHALPITLHGV